MKTYQVTLTITLQDDSHPRKWVPEAICDNLDFDKGEDLHNYDFKLLSAEEVEALNEEVI